MEIAYRKKHNLIVSRFIFFAGIRVFYARNASKLFIHTTERCLRPAHLEYKHAPRVVNHHSRFVCRTTMLTIDHMVHYPFWWLRRESELVVLTTTPRTFLFGAAVGQNLVVKFVSKQMRYNPKYW